MSMRRVVLLLTAAIAAKDDESLTMAQWEQYSIMTKKIAGPPELGSDVQTLYDELSSSSSVAWFETVAWAAASVIGVLVELVIVAKGTTESPRQKS